MTILKTLKIDYFLIYQAVVSFEGWNIRSNREEVNAELQKVIDFQAAPWGIKV